MIGVNGGCVVDVNILEICYSQVLMNIIDNLMFLIQLFVNFSLVFLKKKNNGGGMFSKMFDEDDMMLKWK